MAKLQNLKVSEVSFCKLGMNQHAKVALFKSADAVPTTGPLAIAKRSFDEALRGQLISDQISEVFWRAFDKQYAVREAFREALADELADGGDGSAATEGFTAAMQTIAETAATLAREAGEATDTDLESAVEQAVEKWLKQQETSEMKITTKAALKAAVAAFNPDTSPAAHISIIKAAAVALDAADELPSEGLLAVEKQDPALAKALKDVAVLKLSPDVRKHYDGLAETDQVAFLAKAEADQTAEVEAANATDPVVYKTADGTLIRKSDGVIAAIMAKRMDEQAAEISVLKGSVSASAVEARAATQFPNVAKATAVSMLKSIDQLGEGTDAGKDMLKSLTAMNASSSRLFKSLGSTEAPEVSGDLEKARTDFNTEVSKIMTRDGLGQGDAMSKARTEFPDLFAEAYPQPEDTDA